MSGVQTRVIGPDDGAGIRPAPYDGWRELPDCGLTRRERA